MSAPDPSDIVDATRRRSAWPINAAPTSPPRPVIGAAQDRGDAPSPLAWPVNGAWPGDRGDAPSPLAWPVNGAGLGDGGDGDGRVTGPVRVEKAVGLHYEVAGKAGRPVLVLSSSLGTSLSMWDAQVPALSQHFRVLRVDTRGHGGSPVPPGPYSIAGLGRDFLKLLDGLGLERVSFCGLSLGAMIGMWLAAQAPQRIDRLALCCTSAHLPPAQGWADRAAAVRSRGMTAVADVVVSRWFTPAFPETAVYKRLLESTPAEGYAGCCEAIAAMDLRPVLGDITAPTLVVSGRDDPATPQAHQELLASEIRGARLVRVPGAHLANVEFPSQVTMALLNHFTEGGT